VIRTLEELSLNAWPALHTLLVDGWVLRFADGYTRRANSVSPLYPGERDVRDRVGRCERLYQGRGLPTVFKLTPESEPAGLDDVLAAEGYAQEATTSVQALDLLAQGGAAAPEVNLAPSLTAEWSAAFGRFGRVGAERQAIHERLLRLILPARRFASLAVDGQVVGCGLGVLQDGFLGVYDVVVDRDHRRRGLGAVLVRALLGWGQAEGAHTAYLQVMLDNEPALRLYGGLGFREVYRYRYRVKRKVRDSPRSLGGQWFRCP